MEKNLTQSVWPTSPASIALGMESVRPLAALGVEIRSHLELVGAGATVRIAPMHGVTQEKSALIARKRAEKALSGTLQLNGYGFGTPVDVDVPRVGVVTGVPPRSRPV